MMLNVKGSDCIRAPETGEISVTNDKTERERKSLNKETKF